ncbi:hypothetical protein ACFOWM_07885 [Ferruginibacter yonginensis]|uniref:Uncharacterized protein n=1 Tax=Ferruginibacter yonginensis TaxID=1310416 RepID=A0ABV8QR53_9BACT
MKKFLIIIILAFVTTNLLAQTNKPLKATTATTNDLSFLKKLEGKYPAGLLEHPKLKSRLKKMMVLHYDFVNNEVWQTLIPNRVEGDYFIAEGMQLHSGGDPSACIIVNLKTNEIFVGVRDQIEYLYAEKSIEMPAILKKWAVKTYPPTP